MAKNSQSNRTAPIDVMPPESTGVIAAWQGLYHALGARFDSTTITDDGLVINGFTVDSAYDPETVIRDVNVKGRRVQLFPTIRWINGEAPEPFTDAADMTAWQVGNYRGSVSEGSTRTPEYVRKAFAALKGTMGISNKRGPKPKTINLKNLANLDASVLRQSGVDLKDLQFLIDVAQSVVDEGNASETPAEVAS